jgi:hypothetical protein
MSTTLASRLGVVMVKRASFMWCEYVESSPPRVRSQGNTPSRTMVSMVSGASLENRDQRST